MASCLRGAGGVQPECREQPCTCPACTGGVWGEQSMLTPCYYPGLTLLIQAFSPAFSRRERSDRQLLVQSRGSAARVPGATLYVPCLHWRGQLRLSELRALILWLFAPLSLSPPYPLGLLGNRLVERVCDSRCVCCGRCVSAFSPRTYAFAF